MDSGRDATADARKDVAVEGGDSGKGLDSSSSGDTGGDAPGEVGVDACAVTASWDPSKLSNLALWLNDKGIFVNASGWVMNWADESGNGNEAAAFNTGGGNMTVDPGAANGHDAVIGPGNGVGLEVLDSASLQFGTSGFVIGVVVKTGMTDQAPLFTKDNGGGNPFSVIEDPSGDYVFSIASQSIKLTPTDHAHFHSVIATGEAMSLESDGVTPVTGPTSTTDVSNPGAVTYLFSLTSHPSGNADEIAEVVVAKGPISCADVANLAAYFKTRFALP